MANSSVTIDLRAPDANSRITLDNRVPERDRALGRFIANHGTFMLPAEEFAAALREVDAEVEAAVAALSETDSARTLPWRPCADSARTLPGWSRAYLGELEMVAEPADELAGCTLAEALIAESVAALPPCAEVCEG